MDEDRPRVVLRSTMTLDGRITTAPGALLLDHARMAEWHALQPPGVARLEAARDAHLEERSPGAWLEGSGSFTTPGDRPDPLPEPVEDPPLADHLPAAVRDAPERASWFAVVDSGGRCRWSYVGEPRMPLLVLVTRATPAAYRADLRRRGIAHLVVGEGRVDLRLAVARLGELGVRDIVLDAGGGLTAAMLAAGLVDELQIVVVPAVVGGAATPSLVSGPAPLAGSSPLAGPGLRLSPINRRIEDDGAMWLGFSVERA